MDFIILSLITLIAGSGFSFLIKKHSGEIATIAIALSFLMLIFTGIQPTKEYLWIQPLGIKFGVLLDKLSFPLASIILLISAVASYFSIDYMKGNKNVHLYFVNLLLFTLGMYGVVLSTNFIQFYVFWEVMVIPVYFLIAYWGSAEATKIALKFFIFMHAGALMILLAILWIYTQTGSFSLLQTASIPVDAARWISLFFLFGFGVKMAIFPVHGWLPDAHSEAPAPISAMLSGLMIALGGYGIIRIVLPLFGFVLINYSSLLMYLALITMFYGSIMALAQTDIKRLFAYSSVSQMGYIFFGLSIMSTLGTVGSTFQIINHAMVKALLFLISGVILHSTHTRDMRKLGGLLGVMPITAFATLVATLSLSGTPLLNMFVSELMIFQAGVQSGRVLETGIAIVITLFTAGYSLWMVKRVFFGERPKGLKVEPESFKMKLVMIFLSVLIILIGFLPNLILQLLM